MRTKSRYEGKIWQAKSAITDMLEYRDEFNISMEEYLSDSRTAAKTADIVSRWILSQPSMIERIALATVLASGAFDEGNGAFYMPSTEDCCRNFRAVRKVLKHHKHIDVFAYGVSRENEQSMSWRVRFM